MNETKRKRPSLHFYLVNFCDFYFLVRQFVSTPTKSTKIYKLEHIQSPINKSCCNETTVENTTIIDIKNISVMISNDGNVTIINSSDDSDSSTNNEECFESVNGDEESSSDLDRDR